MKKRAVFFLSVALPGLLLGLFLTHCGADNGSTPVPTYFTSSNRGDRAIWAFNGSDLSALWYLTNPTSGTIAKTIAMNLICQVPDANYGTKNCTVRSAKCTDGTSACASTDAPAAGSLFQAIEISKVALLVLTPDKSRMFIGTAGGDCSATGSDDFVYLNHAIGGYDLGGIFRLDANFQNVVHSDFRFTGSVSTPAIRYSTTDTNGALNLGTPTCFVGIRDFKPGTPLWQGTLTTGGMFTVDKTSGEGGIVGFKASSAATVTDLAGKALRGFYYPDSGTAMRMGIQMGTAGTDSIAIQGFDYDTDGTKPPSPIILQKFAVTTTPFTGTAVTNLGSNLYSTNPLSTTYANLSTIPGLFYIPAPNPATDKSSILVAVTKQNGKILLFGAVFNDRSPTVSNATALPITANFVAFEL